MAEGNIGSVQDEYEFHTTDTDLLKILHVSGHVFAIAFKDGSDHGWVKTVAIADDGTITKSVIASYEFESTRCYSLSMVRVSANVFAIIYDGIDSDGFLLTFEIADNGTMVTPFVDSWEFDTDKASGPEIIHVSGHVFAIVYQDLWSDGWIKTVTIADNGTITKSFINTLEYEITESSSHKIMRVTGFVFAVMYAGADKDGYIKTFTITDDGVISGATIDDWEFDEGYCGSMSMLSVGANALAMIYSDVSSHGWIVTVTIADDGTITKTLKSQWEYDSVAGKHARLTHISGTVYAITFANTANDGYIKTITIAVDGTITESFIDELEYEEINALKHTVLFVNGNIYAIAYRGDAGDGFLKTIDVETIAPGKPGHLMMMGIG